MLLKIFTADISLDIEGALRLPLTPFKKTNFKWLENKYNKWPYQKHEMNIQTYVSTNPKNKFLSIAYKINNINI